jgi:mono/diheme cytochrome c family protein
MVAVLVGFGGWLWLPAVDRAVGQPADDGASARGFRIFKSANCMGCHKWSGVGGGGYGGAAANLRETKLNIEQIEETVRCGRPSTGMPHFSPDAYSDGQCYGLRAADLPPGQMPPEPDHPLRPADIQAVAKYVVTHIKGQGEPDLAQCQAFFGTTSRVCAIYMNQTAAAAMPDPGMAAPHHARVETAEDANASSVQVQK